MMEHVVDFLGYMFFSSLEYFAIFLMIFSLFKLYPRYFVKEIITLTFATTLTTYFFIITGIYEIIPAPFITVPTIWLLLYLFMKNKIPFETSQETRIFNPVAEKIMNVLKIDEQKLKVLTFVFVISTIGFAVSSIIQVLVAGLFIYFKYVNVSQLSDSFTLKTYFIQSINATVSVTVALYVGVSRSGFSFTFKNGNYKKFVFVATALLFTLGVTFYMYLHNETIGTLFLIFGGSLIASSLILLFLSHRRENYEYK